MANDELLDILVSLNAKNYQLLREDLEIPLLVKNVSNILDQTL